MRHTLGCALLCSALLPGALHAIVEDGIERRAILPAQRQPGVDAPAVVELTNPVRKRMTCPPQLRAHSDKSCCCTVRQRGASAASDAAASAARPAGIGHGTGQVSSPRLRPRAATRTYAQWVGLSIGHVCALW